MNRHRVVLKVFCVILITATLFVRAQAEEKTSNDDPALKRWLEKYPASDSDGRDQSHTIVPRINLWLKC